MSPRVTTSAIAGAACAVLAAAGCSAVSLHASEARAPILLGPVACIGCAPEPGRGAAPPTVSGGVRQRELIVGMFGGIHPGDTKPLDVAATKAVADPCREDLHVSSIHSGAWSFMVPLGFGVGDTWVDVQASRAPVPNGTCGGAPWPSSGPTGIVVAAPEKPREGTRP
jgi:hypothetical protein